MGEGAWNEIAVQRANVDLLIDHFETQASTCQSTLSREFLPFQMMATLSDIANWAQILAVPIAVLAWLVTADRFGRFWKRWFKLIFGIVLVLALWGAGSLGWLNWLPRPVTIPLWLILLLFLSGFIVNWFVGQVTRGLTSGVPRLPTSDDVDGIEWHWGYAGKHIDEFSFSAFCPNPNCRGRLEPQRASNFRALDDIALVCSHCGFSRDFDCDGPTLVHRIALEIERRFRTGQYAAQRQ